MVLDEEIWYRDPLTLLRNTWRYVPMRDDALTVQLNALMRLSIYFALIVFAFRHSVNSLAIPVLTAVITFAIHESKTSNSMRTEKTLETLGLQMDPEGRPCVRPTRDNPFMNVSLIDRADFPKRPSACKLTHKEVKKQAEAHFDHDLYRDADDVFNRRSSSRQFYTTPSTTIPNDQHTFAKWLYDVGPTRKESHIKQLVV